MFDPLFTLFWKAFLLSCLPKQFFMAVNNLLRTIQCQEKGGKNAVFGQSFNCFFLVRLWAPHAIEDYVFHRVSFFPGKKSLFTWKRRAVKIKQDCMCADTPPFTCNFLFCLILFFDPILYLSWLLHHPPFFWESFNVGNSVQCTLTFGLCESPAPPKGKEKAF